MRKLLNKPEWDLYSFCQNAIDLHYLQPYPQCDTRKRSKKTRVKKNLKDGYIERFLHGALHVGRASIHPLKLIDLFRQCFPEYTRQSIEALTFALEVDESLLIKLIRASVIYHDSAREDEAEDRWDKQSGAKLSIALLDYQFSLFLASFFESATANKDAPAEFEKYCSHTIPSLSIQYAHFIRKIINLSDCFDSMRCRGKFDFSYVIRQLKDIPEYSEDSHLPLFLEFGQQLHTAIWDQGDMYFDCKLTLNNQTILTERTGQNFIQKLKVRYEHAPNAVSVIAAHMKTYPYFQPLLENELLSCSDFAAVEHAFDPFIHGTQSGALSILKLMKDRGRAPVMTSPHHLLSLSLAPMTGELSRHGASRKFTDSSYLCFSRLKLISHNRSQYGFDNVLSYATRDAGELTEKGLVEKTIDTFKYYYKECLDTGFTYLHTTLVYYIRAKFLGIDDALLFEKDGKHAFLELYKATIQFYHLLLLLHDKLRVNTYLKYILDQQKLEEISQVIYSSLTMKELINRIRRSGIDIKSIRENPTYGGLESLLSLFELPNQEQLFSGSWLEVHMEAPEAVQIKCDYASDFRLLSTNENHCGINWFLLNYFKDYPACQTLVGTQEFIPQHILHMQEHLHLLGNVFKKKYESILHDEIQYTLLLNNFPVLLLSNNDQAITIARFDTQEYRANRPLVFGKDISMLATDNVDNAITLRRFLLKNGFEHVGVVLFSELKKCVSSTLRPNILGVDHQRPIPTLSWMSAKAVVPGTVQKRIGKSTLEILHQEMQKAEMDYLTALKRIDQDSELILQNKYLKAKAEYERVSDQFYFHLGEAEMYDSSLKK